MKRPTFKASSGFIQWPDEHVHVPVLTDVIEQVNAPGEPALWLAWDGTRVPLLTDEIKPTEIDPGTALVRTPPPEDQS